MSIHKLDIKELTKRVKAYVKEYGLEASHNVIKHDYQFFPELRKTMLFILYDEFAFYPFKNKEKIK